MLKSHTLSGETSLISWTKQLKFLLRLCNYQPTQDFAAAAVAAGYAFISPGALKQTAYASTSGAAQVLLPEKPLTPAAGPRPQRPKGGKPGAASFLAGGRALSAKLHLLPSHRHTPPHGRKRLTPAGCSSPPASRHHRAHRFPPHHRYFVFSNLTGGRAVKPPPGRAPPRPPRPAAANGSP